MLIFNPVLKQTVKIGQWFHELCRNMMSDFRFYFDLGWQHILNREALDHLLFITALVTLYLLKDWKQV